MLNSVKFSKIATSLVDRAVEEVNAARRYNKKEQKHNIINIFKMNNSSSNNNKKKKNATSSRHKTWVGQAGNNQQQISRTWHAVSLAISAFNVNLVRMIYVK